MEVKIEFIYKHTWNQHYFNLLTTPTPTPPYLFTYSLVMGSSSNWEGGENLPWNSCLDGSRDVLWLIPCCSHIPVFNPLPQWILVESTTVMRKETPNMLVFIFTGKALNKVLQSLKSITRNWLLMTKKYKTLFWRVWLFGYWYTRHLAASANQQINKISDTLSSARGASQNSYLPKHPKKTSNKPNQRTTTRYT